MDSEIGTKQEFPIAEWHFSNLPPHNQAKIIGAFASLMRRVRAEEAAGNTTATAATNDELLASASEEKPIKPVKAREAGSKGEKK